MKSTQVPLIVLWMILLVGCASSGTQKPEEGSGKRGFSGVGKVESLKSTMPGRKWAVVIGVADYADSSKAIPDLKYTDDDARAFYEFVVDEYGANVPAENARLLVNEKATAKEIQNARYSKRVPDLKPAFLIFNDSRLFQYR